MIFPSALSFLTTGTILGLSAGFAPGPLLALVVSETLQHDMKAGVKVALAPILTDLPIIIFTLFILAKLSRFHHVLGAISIIGACFILYMGIDNCRTKGMDISDSVDKPKSLQRGIIVNALSPYPYLFWFSVGGPTTIKAMDVSLLAAISFIGSFYILLVGAKIVLAILVGKSRSFLQGNAYIFSMRLLGIVLILLAVILFRDGLHLLGIL
jgi:threonine/homoserine/homoserine lactone efflux protein